MATQGPNSPNSANCENISTGYYGGDTAWSRPDNAAASDSQTATATLTSNQTCHGLEVRNFGFSIPSDNVIDGVLVEVECLRVGESYQLGAGYIHLLSATESLVGTEKTFFPSSTSLTYDSFGGSSDKWGAALTPAIVNGTGFGAAIYGLYAYFGENGTAQIDHVRITVTYSPPSGGGNFFALFRKGWKWLKDLFGVPQPVLCQQRSIQMKECNV